MPPAKRQRKLKNIDKVVTPPSDVGPHQERERSATPVINEINEVDEVANKIYARLKLLSMIRVKRRVALLWSLGSKTPQLLLVEYATFALEGPVEKWWAGTEVLLKEELAAGVNTLSETVKRAMRLEEDFKYNHGSDESGKKQWSSGSHHGKGQRQKFKKGFFKKFGLQKGDFLFMLSKEPLESMSELMYETQKLMNGEDALNARDSPPGKGNCNTLWDENSKMVIHQGFHSLKEDAKGIHQPHDDSLVVTINIAGFTKRRVLVDNESSADILYLPTYQQMKLDKEKLRPMDAPLVDMPGSTRQVGHDSIPEG
uniref:Uncharacterized protein n=1 Tax=Fagus sylvatica TaxID=28930 RepID=A0A2N9HF18_FAGSY